ncbi:uncharacterized protein LOC118159232 [Oxyura jamaicensis]|uniref:uncharacterized protein LOC118159232 n=1 Tax=Oxyura jamaicensis TaxID=8884 RepID=UPI0015A6967F|nr:uncharacterized protein LOC118159232 [Oxyura jamaicensis]
MGRGERGQPKKAAAADEAVLGVERDRRSPRAPAPPAGPVPAMATPDVSVHMEEVVVVTTPDNAVDGSGVEEVKTVLVTTNLSQHGNLSSPRSVPCAVRAALSSRRHRKVRIRTLVVLLFVCLEWLLPFLLPQGAVEVAFLAFP